jgi:hypothetical protein
MLPFVFILGILIHRYHSTFFAVLKGVFFAENRQVFMVKMLTGNGKIPI